MARRLEVKGNMIKEANYKKIIQLICKEKELTKLDIAYTLKISIPTVTTNINELKEVGMIEEVESDIYTGGRKPKVIKLLPNARVGIGMSITKSKVAVVVINLLNEIILKKETAYQGAHFMDYIALGKTLVDEVIKELALKDENILGIGISVPGTINESIGMAEHTNMGHKDILLEPIYESFKQNVYIENEANLSLIAEKTIGGYEDLSDLIYIGINEGLGGGIYVNGKLFKGVNGRAGEFGQMLVAPRQEEGLGQSVEDYISTKSLVEKYNEVAVTSIKDFDEFKAKIQQGEALATEILEQGIQILLMTVYNLGMIFDIKQIIIGGKVGRLINETELLTPEMAEPMVVNFSNIRGTTAIGAALLPILDYYE